MRGIEVLHDDIGQPTRRGYIGEKLLQRSQPSGRGTETHYPGERSRLWFGVSYHYRAGDFDCCASPLNGSGFGPQTPHVDSLTGGRYVARRTFSAPGKSAVSPNGCTAKRPVSKQLQTR